MLERSGRHQRRGLEGRSLERRFFTGGLQPALPFFGKRWPQIRLGASSGYDVWYELIWGTRTAIYLSFVLTVSSAILGALIGSMAGDFGGMVDDLFMRFTNMVFAFLSLVLNIALAFVLTDWAGYAHLVRSEVMRVSQLEYVECACALRTPTPIAAPRDPQYTDSVCVRDDARNGQRGTGGQRRVVSGFGHAGRLRRLGADHRL